MMTKCCGPENRANAFKYKLKGFAMHFKKKMNYQNFTKMALRLYKL